VAATDHRSDPTAYLQELLRRFQGRSIGETAEDIVLEVIGSGKGWRGKPTRRQVKQAALLLVIALQSSPDNKVRIQAARMLGDLKRAKWTVASLIAALADDDSDVRASAALALGHLGNKRAVKPLIHLLMSDESMARMRTAREMDKSTWLAFNSVSQGQRERQVRLSAAEALGLLGDRRAVKPLITVLLKVKAKVVHAPTTMVVDDKDKWYLDLDYDAEEWEESEVRAKVAEALGELKDPQAVDPLCTTLADKWGQVSTQAAWSLRKLGDKRAVGPLLVACEYPNSELHQAVSYALRELCDEQAIDFLIAALSSGSSGIRRGAADLLGELKAVQAVEPLVATLADEDSWVRAQVVSTLGKIGDQRVCETLFAQAQQDDEESVRSAAVLALARLHDGRAFAPLIAALKVEEPARRPFLDGSISHMQAIDGLADLGDPRAIEPLLTALQKEEGYAKTRVVDALVRLGDRRAVEPLIALLATEGDQTLDITTKSHAIDALALLGDQRAVDPLITFFDQEAARATTSQEFFAFKAEHAAQALGVLGDARAVEPLISYLKDHMRIRWDIASYVIEALGKLGDPAALPALKWALRYDGDKILELKPAARSKYRIYEVKVKATEAIAQIMDTEKE
jgi:HEAT repeat protein